MVAALDVTRVAIIGAGHVGATFAYSLLMSGLATEIVLIDADRRRAEGEAMDLAHAAALTRATRIIAGDYDDCVTADVTVITAGAGQRPGEMRLALAERNAVVVREIAERVGRLAPEGILLIATNPVDALTYVAQRASGLPAQRVIGSGTILDSARFRFLLGQHYGIDPGSVHAYILGEHGDSEVPAWSLANIAGARLPEYCAASGHIYDKQALDEIFIHTRDAAYAIIERKGATYYAIAAGLLRIVRAIVRDERSVLTVSSVSDGAYGIRDVSLSLPSVVGRGGIGRVLELELAAEEAILLRRSGEVIRSTIDRLPLR